MDMRELRRLNFRELISIGATDIDNYDYEVHRKKGYEHAPIVGYCTSCEELGINTAHDDESFKLTNISHGAHSSDFFLSLADRVDTSGWHQEPIMFVYESPSRDYDIFRDFEYKGNKKRPSVKWYWIHEIRNCESYPSRFKGREYGDFVLSAILTFKLANVYMTNLVKCGLNNSARDFKGIASFRPECVTNCYNTFLAREIDILKPMVIFAVGSGVHDRLIGYVKDPCLIQQLPHPAGARRGFRDEHFKVLYFWLVVRALHKAGIIQTSEGSALAKMFLERYDGLSS